jgi:Ca-activated chloride channel family protein
VVHCERAGAVAGRNYIDANCFEEVAVRFENFNLLWLLLILPPALISFFWWAVRQKEKLLTQFIQARLLPALTIGISPTRRKIRFTLLILAVAFLIFALARPQYGFDLQEIEQRGLDIVVAIDTSKSMLATDIAPNRLERAKLAAIELMQDAKSDRLGLVAFAGDAFLECPLTIDNTAFEQSVQALNVNSIPQGGTAIAAAIQTAQTAFKENDAHKVLVLLTDGEDNVNEADALAAAKVAAKDGLKVFTIGIGTAEGDLLRITDANGNSDYVRDELGNVVKSHLNENLLQQIAGATGGFYLPLRGADTMDTLYERGLAPLPKSEGKEKLIKRYHEQYQWPLGATIFFLLVEIFLPERAKSKVQNSKYKVEASTIAALMAIFLIPIAANASPSSALRDYKAGNYTNALAEYGRLAEVQTNDLRLVFNAGAAAYHATNYDEAAKDFVAATLAPDLKLQQQAYYNLGDTQFRMGELKFEPSAEGLEAVEENWKAALQSFSRAAQLDTNDMDATYNLAFVKNQIDLIEQLREAMRRAKMEADDAVRRAQFHRALGIMEQIAQNKIAAKQFQDYIKKLKDVDAIATTNQK